MSMTTLELLKLLAAGNPSSDWECPSCFRCGAYVHSADCDLAAKIKELEAQEPLPGWVLAAEVWERYPTRGDKMYASNRGQELIWWTWVGSKEQSASGYAPSMQEAMKAAEDAYKRLIG